LVAGRSPLLLSRLTWSSIYSRKRDMIFKHKAKQTGQ